MAGREVVHGDGGALNQTQKFKFFSHDRPLDSLFASAASNSFMGSRTMFSFGAVGRANGSGNSFLQSFDQEENGEEYLGEYFNQPDKKKRLSEDQLQFLERSFEAENKLEHERKIQLANELGLQPRNVAVWFQNRRARWKTKQLETDYETLHASYKNLETDYAYLLKENEKLKLEVLNLKHNGRSGDTVQLNSQPHDTEKPSEAMPKEAVAYMLHEGEKLEVPALDLRNEEQSSAGSDLTNAECLWSIHGIHPIVDSCHVLELDQSDLSHNGEDSLKEELLQHAYIFPKIKDTYCHPHANSCSVEDHAFSFWSSY